MQIGPYNKSAWELSNQTLKYIVFTFPVRINRCKQTLTKSRTQNGSAAAPRCIERNRCIVIK